MAEEKEITISRHMRYMFNQFARNIRKAPPWELISETLENELKEVFGSDFENHYKIASSVVLFAKATGGLPKDKEERTELLRLIAPMLKSDAEAVISLLQKFMYASRSINAADVYSKGQVNPKLVAILNDRYEMTEELYKHYYGTSMVQSDLILYLIREGKIDFTPFKSDANKEDDWYFDYRISASPLPVPTGYPVLTLDRIKESAGKEYVSLLSELKDDVRRSLSGLKATEDVLKNVKDVETDQDGYVRRPVEPEVFLQFVTAIEKQYQRREQENTRLDYAAPFRSPYEAGFYVNPVTCTIYDLRPYYKDLHNLFSVRSWDYLKEYTDTVREVIRELREEQVDESDLLQSLFPDTYYFPPADKKNVRNLPVSKPVKRLIRAYAAVNISGQSLDLKGRNGEVLQRVSFADATGKPSEQVINSFDISIMNCVGSLQQKNPTKKFFTDIAIAKEFNSTTDKQGHITPDSKIVQDVRQSMKRLSTVYGKIDVTEQIAQELKKRHPNKKKINNLQKGQERLAIMQPLVKIDKIGVHILKNDKDTLCYSITEAPPFYLHGALTKQMVQVPFEQLTSNKSLTTEMRLLREYTRINVEAAISMQREGLKADTIRFNKILDDTYRTSADPAENVERAEMTQVVQKIPERKRYRLQTYILNYLDELQKHNVINGYKVVKKKIPGKTKVIEYGFTIFTEQYGR